MSTVISKYFAGSSVMDESLSEFKEKRKGNTGPKKIENKPKVKKAPKRIRGQKDIRTVLKSKKNELLNYAKEFDEVCKISGVDVDSEQLQLAIALSKSVQPAEDECSSQSAALSATERSGRIRTTLQEYGFTVPEVKITSNKRQKKKIRKHYKLLLATEAEKQQLTSDRYSQVLFENVCNDNETTSAFSLTNKRFYYLSTCITYTELKSNDVLYADNLIAKSSSNGVLLKDWASIPGRPQSPVVKEKLNMNFSEIECSQEELDIVLSGTLKSAKSIFLNKANIIKSTPTIVVNDESNIDATSKTSCENENKAFERPEKDNLVITLVDDKVCFKDSSLVNRKNSLVGTLERVRSKSPDIFDEEVSEVWEDSNINTENLISSRENNIKVATDSTKDNSGDTEINTLKDVVEVDSKNNLQVVNKEQIDCVMDLTQDEDDNRSVSSPKGPYLISNSNNFTRRNSNDYMEITECVPVSAQSDSKITFQNKSKTRRLSNDFMEITDCVDNARQEEKAAAIEDNIDLTQNSDISDDSTLIDAIVTSVKDKIINPPQSSHSGDELPFVQISGNDNNSLDDTILLNSDEIAINQNPVLSSDVNTLDLTQTPPTTTGLNKVLVVQSPDLSSIHIDDVSVEQTQNNKNNSHTLDLNQTSTNLTDIENMSPCHQSFYEDFLYNHSDDTNKGSFDVTGYTNNSSKAGSEGKIDLTQSSLQTSNICKDVEVDLTQSSNSSENSMHERLNASTDDNPVKINLGKKDEVSIDYDDLDDVVQEHTDTAFKTDSNALHNSACDITDDNDEETSENPSRSSQVFDLSDKELEYSLNKSRNYLATDINFGGISIMDDISHLGHSDSNIKRHSSRPNNSMNRSMSDSYLPVVDIKGYLPKVKKPCTTTEAISENVDHYDEINQSTTELQPNSDTPHKAAANKNAFTTNTPKSSEYFIKMDQVTPMLDYASMSTPERNKELDKYGLKRFKRKRAIQLLTHLYNQTHPVVESWKEDLPSPSKKRKHFSQPSPIKPTRSPKKLDKSLKKVSKSPRKLLRSPRKLSRSPNKLSDSALDNPRPCEDSNIYEVTNELPDIRDILCVDEDWVFQKREKAKVHSCRVPLHIALHNYVSCRRKLREAILQYEPVEIDVIHKGLVASGYRYDPKELLKYMDKKCITVKTADNNARNNR